MNKTSLQSRTNRHILIAGLLALAIFSLVLFPVYKLLLDRRVADKKTAMLDLMKNKEAVFASELFMNRQYAIDIRSKELISIPGLGQSVDMDIYNQAGDIYYASTPDAKPVLDPDIVSKVRTAGALFVHSRLAKSLTLIYPLKLGETVIGYAHLKVKDPSLGIFGDVSILVTTLLTAGFIIFFVLLLMQRFVRRHIIMQLRKIGESLEKISEKNDFDMRIPIESKDEIGLLASGINEMFVRVKESESYREKNRQLAAIGQISSHIGHDMRSPLSVLKSYVNVDTGPADADMQEYRRAAVRSVDKLLKMADNLVDYAKATKVERAPVDLNRFLKDSVIGEARIIADEKKINIECGGCGSISVDIDAFKMGRALVNMINNAIQAIPHEHGRISINSKIAGEDLEIAISDNGKGIEQKHLPRVFDDFYTIDKRGGIGLGLSYCKQVVEAHGGRIEVQSEVGRGATFTILIPRCVANRAKNRKMPETSGRMEYRGKRVLIADDEDEVRLDLKRFIEKNGGKVIWESDSPEKVVRDFSDFSSVDMAVVDYMYPGHEMTGVDLIGHLKANGVKEIHLRTGYAGDPEIRAAAFAAGAASVVGKG